MLKKIKSFLSRGLDNRDITYENAKKIIRKNKKAYLIDVRSKQEYDEGHLTGAINICLYNIEQEILKIDKDSTIILYCASGIRSKRAREILEDMGYKEVYNLKNGIERIN